MTRDIKICGLSTPDTMNAAIEAGATHVGLIFFEKSPRNVTLAEAATLADLARGKATSVAVTVSADDATLDGIVENVRPAMLQLHGKESPERTAEIRRRYGLPVMKAIAIRERADLDRAKDYLSVADRLLLDAKAPDGAALPGGNGLAFDWSLLASLDEPLEYMLSGGLNGANIAAAFEMTHACGFDISSGVESAPGVKDAGMIRSFLATVRALEAKPGAADARSAQGVTP